MFGNNPFRKSDSVVSSILAVVSEAKDKSLTDEKPKKMTQAKLLSVFKKIKVKDNVRIWGKTNSMANPRWMYFKATEIKDQEKLKIEMITLRGYERGNTEHLMRSYIKDPKGQVKMSFGEIDAIEIVPGVFDKKGIAENIINEEETQMSSEDMFLALNGLQTGETMSFYAKFDKSEPYWKKVKVMSFANGSKRIILQDSKKNRFFINRTTRSWDISAGTKKGQLIAVKKG